jgi:hypothetical protein
MQCRLPLAVSAVSSFVPDSVHHGASAIPASQNHTVQISRSGFVMRIHHFSSGIFSWFGADSRSSIGDIDFEFGVATIFHLPDTSAWATPSLASVAWSPLAGVLRFPTFPGTMGFYDCSRSIRNPSGRRLGHVPPIERRSGALFGSWTLPLETCPGLATPARYGPVCSTLLRWDLHPLDCNKRLR